MKRLLGIVIAILLVIGVYSSLPDHQLSMSARVSNLSIKNSDGLLLTNFDKLRMLEKHGAAFERQLGSISRSKSLNQLTNNITYAHLRDQIKADLKYQKRLIDSPALPYSGPVTEFDINWLTSKNSSFELVALVNRVDRAMSLSNTCGEVRMIYRLRYDLEGKIKQASRLPMTVNLVYVLREPKSGDCLEMFRAAELPSNKGDKLDRLKSSSVWAPILEGKKAFDDLEINVQISRWPAIYNSNFAEQSHYLLRVLARNNDGSLIPKPLENTPNVSKIKQDPQLKERLRLWIIHNLESINKGTHRLPIEFLATKAVSVSPFGLNRRVNRPFFEIFSPDTFAKEDLQKFSHVGSPQALVRRLDTFSCIGCHQSRAVAGFHLLGAPDGPLGFNQIATPASTHLRGVLPWRREIFRKFTRGDKELLAIPSPERSPYVKPGIGSHCNLGDPGFKTWTCGPSLLCYDSFPDSMVGRPVGTCYPRVLEYNGAPCDTPKLLTHFHPVLDQLHPQGKLNCPDKSVCATSLNGFPAGLCASRCSDDDDDTLVCLDSPELGPFSECLQSGDKTFKTCLLENSFKAGMPACDVTTPCRDEYVCLGVEGGKGACLPPYVLPQLNIDNHPKF